MLNENLPGSNRQYESPCNGSPQARKQQCTVSNCERSKNSHINGLARSKSFEPIDDQGGARNDPNHQQTDTGPTASKTREKPTHEHLLARLPARRKRQKPQKERIVDHFELDEVNDAAFQAYGGGMGPVVRIQL